MQAAIQNQTLIQKLYNLQGTLHFLRFIKNPQDTKGIIKMVRSFRNSAPSDVVEKIIGPILEKTNLQQDFDDRVWHHHPKMAELSKYPEGSFGHEAYLFFKNNNLDENLFPKADFSDVPNYISSRVYQTHDFWHVLTGYSINLEDEMALQAFSVGQYKQPTGMTIIAGGIIHMMQSHPERSYMIMNAITEGYERGLKAKLLLNINIFQYLEWPLEDVRKELNILPRTRSFEVHPVSA
ncbi:MAG: hypothetical protein K0R29_1183 [Pseudobdellovibrio sp.]|jgi:ubiquinone biosynthesis protein Coq4|nr:hypothetical protein [Pseudobdellovibrio sp.]